MIGWIVAALMTLLAARWRAAYYRADADTDQVADDYQDLGREWSEDLDRLETALDRIVRESSDAKAVGLALEQLRETGTIELMKVYAPLRYAALEVENERDRALYDEMRAIMRRERRWWCQAVGFVRAWWLFPGPPLAARFPRLIAAVGWLLQVLS